MLKRPKTQLFEARLPPPATPNMKRPNRKKACKKTQKVINLPSSLLPQPSSRASVPPPDIYYSTTEFWKITHPSHLRTFHGSRSGTATRRPNFASVGAHSRGNKKIASKIRNKYTKSGVYNKVAVFSPPVRAPRMLYGFALHLHKIAVNPPPPPRPAPHT